MAFILALDEGTTSARAIVFDSDGGKAVALAQKEFRQSFPKPGQVEHDPDEIFAAQMGVASEAMSRARLSPKDVAAIGITNQRETTVVWERASGRPVHPAIVWQDRRTADACERLRKSGLEPLVAERTGLRIDSYFPATKIAWILDRVSGARARAERGELAFGTIDSWLLFRMTGGRVHATDATNASRSLLYDIRRGAWDDELCRAFAVPPAVLPEVRSSSEVYGEAGASTPLGGVPIAGIAGDQQAALFGQTCFERGQSKNTYGTGCFLLQNTGDEPVASKHGLLGTIASRVGSRVTYALEGSVFVGGAVVQWLRDGLSLVRKSEDVEALARSVPDSSGVVLVPAFAGLGAPHWDPYARGAIVGITRGTTAAHFARAALEAIAFQVADLLDAVGADSGAALPELRVDGGAARNDLLMQIQADLLGVPVVRPTVTETTALGAAYLAGLASGVYRGREDVASHWKEERRFEPSIPRDAALERRARWNDAVARARGWEKPT